MANKTIKDLTKLWEQEKEHYKTYEIGTGVQKFVKHIFECEELFGLKDLSAIAFVRACALDYLLWEAIPRL